MAPFFLSLMITMAPSIAANNSTAPISTGSIKPFSLKSLVASGMVVGVSGSCVEMPQGVLVTT